MHVDGSCHCGRIRYTAEVAPSQVSVCHCTDCQRLTGSAYRVSVPAPVSSFVLLQGQPKIYLKTTADSGVPRHHAFCSDCGAPVYASAVENPVTLSLRVGTLAQRAALPPVRQIWCSSALHWSADLSDIPSRARQ